eukprot:Pgem_evm1s19812
MCTNNSWEYNDRVQRVLDNTQHIPTCLSDIQESALIDEMGLCEEIILSYTQRQFNNKKGCLTDVLRNAHMTRYMIWMDYPEFQDLFCLMRPAMILEFSRTPINDFNKDYKEEYRNFEVGVFSKWAEEFYENIQLQSQSFYAGLIADCAYMAIPRPLDEVMQGLYYTGYKKIHALKLTVIISTARKIIVAILLSIGRTSDFRALEDANEFQSRLEREDEMVKQISNSEYKKLQILGDKAYIIAGDDSRYVTPHKENEIAYYKGLLKGKFTETDIQNAFGGFNKQHSQKRILVENVIGDLSKWSAFRGSTQKKFQEDMENLERNLRRGHNIPNPNHKYSF